MFKKIFLLLIPFCFAFFAFSSFSFAGCPDTKDIRCSNYQLSLGDMDPVGVDHSVPSLGGSAALAIVLRNFSELLLFMIPIIAAISFLIAGYFYIFSAGDSEKTSKAKTIIKWNVIAMLVAFFSYGLVQIIIQLFSF